MPSIEKAGAEDRGKAGTEDRGVARETACSGADGRDCWASRDTHTGPPFARPECLSALESYVRQGHGRDGCQDLARPVLLGVGGYGKRGAGGKDVPLRTLSLSLSLSLSACSSSPPSLSLPPTAEALADGAAAPGETQQEWLDAALRHRVAHPTSEPPLPASRGSRSEGGGGGGGGGGGAGGLMMAGWLFRRRMLFPGTRKRWFELRGCTLRYYVEPYDNYARGVFDVRLLRVAPLCALSGVGHP